MCGGAVACIHPGNSKCYKHAARSEPGRWYEVAIIRMGTQQPDRQLCAQMAACRSPLIQLFHMLFDDVCKLTYYSRAALKHVQRKHVVWFPYVILSLLTPMAACLSELENEFCGANS